MVLFSQMSDLIQLLPEAIANQISAGEVTPAPSYIVKELLENSVDAGASQIKLEVSEGGMGYVWVTDNGRGMSPNDARNAFKRYATSKLRSIDDLSRLQTMGFRGEALAAISSVSQVELQTRTADAELGFELRIEGGEEKGSQPCVCAQGTSIKAKNIFFNVPARRRFVKSPASEYKAIEKEFKRVALVNPEVSMSLYKDGTLVKDLPISGLKERILAVEGKKLLDDLIPIQYQGPICSIHGYVGKPSRATKSPCQYFFVNERYMRHPYFHKAISLAYEGLLRPDTQPNYFVYFTLPPENVDINIHPQKLEARLIDEQLIWQILSALVRETLSAHATIPVIDFNREQVVEIPPYHGRTTPIALDSEAHISTGRRSFGTGGSTPRPAEQGAGTRSFGKASSRPSASSYDIDWASLGQMWEQQPSASEQTGLFGPEAEITQEQASVEVSDLFFYRSRYIITALKRGIALVDVRRAQERILYDRFVVDIGSSALSSQKLMHPEPVEFSPVELPIAREIIEVLERLGFALAEEAEGHYEILSAPTALEGEVSELLRLLIDEALDSGLERSVDYIHELLARSMAEANAARKPFPTGRAEAEALLANLFASSDPNLTPSGRLIVSTLTDLELSKRFG